MNTAQWTIAAGLWIGLGSATGCLDPLVDDAPAGAAGIVPPGTEVSSVHDDPVLDAQIAAFDGVEGTVARIAGFAAGAPTAYWDFGATPAFAAPLFVLVRRTGDDLVPIDHPTIIDAIPGDPGYSPFWAVLFVEVTDAYAGELVTSVGALQEAERRGLVLAPVQQNLGVNCPAVAGDVALDVGAAAPLPPPSRFFWQGRTVRYFDFGPMRLIDRAAAPEAARYVLRREGGEPLSEPVRGVDMTGDGDRTDTNDIFERAATDPDRSPLCRTIEVAVRADTASIDTSGDQAVAALRDAADLFDPEPVTANVVGFRVTDDVWNCPQQRQEAGL